MQTILSKFLVAGALPIGEDDEKLKLLESASSDLAARLKATPLLAYRVSLVALDDRAPCTDPVHKLAAEVVHSKWQTIDNKIGANPAEVYRAVLLRAIELAAAENPALRTAVTLIALDAPPASPKSKTRQAIAEMLSVFGEHAATEVSAAWINPINMALPKLSAKAKKPHVDKEELTSAISRAAGPTAKGGAALTDPNPQWPNSGQAWAFDFSGRMAEAIQAAITAAGKATVEELQDGLKEIIQGLVRDFERMSIRDAKAELLWIRTSAYSPSARIGFKELNPHDLVLHSALDTARAVNRLAPPSVEYFLRDLVNSQTAKKIRVSELLAAIGPKLAGCPEGQSITADILPAQGRRSLLDAAVRPDTKTSLKEQTGLSDTYEAPLSEFAVRFYRELQIRKLLAIAP